MALPIVDAILASFCPMRRFHIEHIGIAVSDPEAMGRWYKEVLGFDIRLAGGDGEKSVSFVSDANRCMVELFRIPGVEPVAPILSHHLQIHLALESDDFESDGKWLEANGARFIEKCPTALPGDFLLVYHDPWGNCLQLARRNPGRFTPPT